MGQPWNRKILDKKYREASDILQLDEPRTNRSELGVVKELFHFDKSLVSEEINIRLCDTAESKHSLMRNVDTR